MWLVLPFSVRIGALHISARVGHRKGRSAARYSPQERVGGVLGFGRLSGFRFGVGLDASFYWNNRDTWSVTAADGTT